MKKISIISFIFLAVAITIVSCHDKTRPGRNYMPDMAYSRAYETYSENPIFADHQTNRTPVAGTIDRGQLLPFHIAKDKVGDTTNFAKARFVPNPLPPLDSSAMVESERLYLIYCGICHGPKLDGNGPLWKDGNGPFPAAPKNLMDPIIVNMPDGQIFYTATYGKNKMGSYASQLSMRQRWMVIHYIKAQQNKANPPVAVAKDSSSVKK